MRVLNDSIKERVMEYNVEYQRQHGLSPSYREIMHAVGLGSVATVQRYVRRLENEGRLTRASLGNIEPLPQLGKSETVLVPLIGEIACGEPCFEVEHIEESYELPCSVFGSGDLYMLRAFGDSMIEAGIEKGDLLVVRKQDSADDGQIVVALVNGENTLKRLYHRKGKVVLHPENSEMSDIVTTFGEIKIQGVLVGCIKKFE